MIRAVVFDLDGTLLDSTEAIVDSFFHLFDTLGEARPCRAKILAGIGHPLAQELALLTERDATTCADIYRAHYRATAREKTVLYPGVRETLEALCSAGLRLGFATSKQRGSAEMLLEHLGILEYFECRIGPDDVIQPKPHPEAVLKSMAVLGVGADELFFVGDMHFDVLAAAAAGVRCLAVATGYASREALEALQPEAVFDHLDAVSDYVLEQVRPGCCAGFR